MALLAAVAAVQAFAAVATVLLLRGRVDRMWVSVGRAYLRLVTTAPATKLSKLDVGARACVRLARCRATLTLF